MGSDSGQSSSLTADAMAKLEKQLMRADGLTQALESRLEVVMKPVARPVPAAGCVEPGGDQSVLRARLTSYHDALCATNARLQGLLDRLEL